MKCTFYYPKTINTKEWDAIRGKLKSDLEELETGKAPEREVALYLETLLSQAETLEKIPLCASSALTSRSTCPPTLVWNTFTGRLTSLPRLA